LKRSYIEILKLVANTKDDIFLKKGDAFLSLLLLSSLDL